jgi:hypothetical protein
MDPVLAALVLVSILVATGVGFVLLFRPDVLEAVFPDSEWNGRPFWGTERRALLRRSWYRVPVGLASLVGAAILLALLIALRG